MKTLTGVSLIAIILIFTSQCFAAIDPATIEGLWLFDEGSGNVASDSSGNGNDGEILGDPKWVDGKFGKALEFDGQDDWVSVPHSSTVGFSAGTSFTISVWFSGDKVGGALVGKNYEDKSQATPWYLLWDDGGRNKVTMYLRDKAGTSYTAHSTSVVADEDWHLIVGIADASEEKSSIWIDGNKEAEVDFNTGSGYGTTEGVLHIGRHYNRYTSGIIDEVGIFNVALEENDIQTVMNSGLSTVLAVESANKLTTTWANIKTQY